MEIDEIKEEIYKCSKCGLCQSVCPIYKATKNEMYLPRGRYIILNNFFNNQKPLSKEFIKNIDICLNCNLCKDFCPSNINTTEINTYLKNKHNFSKKRIPTHLVFKLFLHYIQFKKFFSKSEFFKNKVKKISREKNIEKKVTFFQGCFNKYINSADKNATINILEEIGFSVSKISTECCGITYLSDGDYKSFIKNAKKIINKIDKETEYIVCTCDSCYNTLKKIIEFIPSANIFNEKLIRLDDLLVRENYNIKNIEGNTFIKPIIRKDSLSFAQKSINNLPSFMENFLYLKHNNLIKKLKKEHNTKFGNKSSDKPYSTCNLSRLGFYVTYKKNIISLSEYLKK